MSLLVELQPPVSGDVIVELDVIPDQNLSSGRVPNQIASLVLWHAQKDPVCSSGSKFIPLFVFIMTHLEVLHEAPKGMDLFKVNLFVRPGNQWYATFESRCWCSVS